MLRPALQASLLKLAEIQPAAQWADFATVGRCNTLRHLKTRGLVEDVGGRYDDEPVGPKPCQWVLTRAGQQAVEEIKAHATKG